MRIAFGGLHVECCTWNPVLIPREAFRELRGEALLAHPEFTPLQAFDVQWVPLLHARAVPGGPIAAQAYAAFKAEFLAGLRAALPIDGLYLAMHGAAFVQGMEDAEGDWIAAARAVVGPDCPIAASYDLHGNVSERVIDALDMFAAYRTAPHIDVDETKARACAMLVDAIRTSVRPFLTWARIPVLLQGERTSTVDEPAASLYARLAEIDARPGIREASLMVGYAWADEPRCTACAVLTGTDAETMQTAAAELAQAYWAARDDFAFGPVTDTIEACLDEATRAMTRPVIVTDSGDNPTAGGVGDRAELLAELLRRGFDDALVAGIADPPATDACYAAGVGATVPLRIGASLDPAGSAPVQASAEILFLLPADIAAERQAVVRIGGVTVVLTGRRRPFHEIADFARLGLDPAAVRLLVVKSGYLAPALAAIANPNLMALSAGVVPQDLTTLPVRHIPRPTFPWDREFGYSPKVQLSARRPQ